MEILSVTVLVIIAGIRRPPLLGLRLVLILLLVLILPLLLLLLLLQAPLIITLPKEPKETTTG